MFDLARRFLNEEEDLGLDDPKIPFSFGWVVGTLLGSICGLVIITVGGREFAKSLFQFGLFASLLIAVVFWLTINGEIQDRKEVIWRSLKSGAGWIVGFYPPILIGWALVGVGFLNGVLILCLAAGLLSAILSGFARQRDRAKLTKVSPS